MKKEKDILLAQKIMDLSVKRDKVIKNLNKQIEKKQIELGRICSHSKTRVRNENHEGGYDHVAEYNKITECMICGKELYKETTHGSYA